MILVMVIFLIIMYILKKLVIYGEINIVLNELEKKLIFWDYYLEIVILFNI